MSCERCSRCFIDQYIAQPWQRFSLYSAPVQLRCINEYLAIDNGGYVYMNRLPKEAEMVFNGTGLPGSKV